MTTLPPHVATFDDVDADQFEQEIRPLNRPVVMRGLVRNWPIVRQAQAGPESIAGYLSALASGADAKVLVGGPQIRGAFFYNARLDGFNFKSFPQTAGFLLDWLVDHAALRAFFDHSGSYPHELK